VTYSVKNLWDRLDACILGQTWPPEFYSWIADSKVRNIFETLAQETQDDLNTLEQLLISQGVKIFKPDLDLDHNRFLPPPMSPRDHMIMIDSVLYESWNHFYPSITTPNPGIDKPNFYGSVWQELKKSGNKVVSVEQSYLCGAMIFLLNENLFSSHWPGEDIRIKHEILKTVAHNRTIKQVHLPGHIDAWFCPVTPGLILSSTDPTRPEMLNLFFKTHFPGWEVVYFEPSLAENYSFNRWSQHNTKNWWLPGFEDNTKFKDYVDNYFNHWLGEVHETVFEVNVIVLDQKNVIINKPLDSVCNKLQQYGVTMHYSPMKHQNFWDSGLACSICELNRKE
jgi:hypothetical protein